MLPVSFFYALKTVISGTVYIKSGCALIKKKVFSIFFSSMCGY